MPYRNKSNTVLPEALRTRLTAAIDGGDTNQKTFQKVADAIGFGNLRPGQLTRLAKGAWEVTTAQIPQVERGLSTLRL